MIALVAVKMQKFPSEIASLSYGELQYLYACIVYQGQVQKRSIELARQRAGPPGKPKLAGR